MADTDIIVIGSVSGSGGSAVAGRLAEDPSLRICVIEAGGTNRNLAVTTPGLLPFISQASRWGFETAARPDLGRPSGYAPTGRGLGGSTAINAMLYIRGNPFDYDRWRAIGCTGWSFADVLPYFRKAENNERGADALHGAEGPLSVMDQRWPNPASLAFIESARILQHRLNPDFNGARQDGVGLYQVTQKGGERWTAARAYLGTRKNLEIHTDAAVQRIVIEGGRATGVEVLKNGQTEILRATAGVVLAAGAFGSPQLLMLSGIGPAQHLQDVGVGVYADRPAVGSNLQDHADYVGSWKTRSRKPIGDSPAGLLRMATGLLRHRFNRSGIMTTPYSEAGGFWRSSPDQPAPDIQFHFFPVIVENHGRTRISGHGFSCHACILRPESRGSVRLAAPDAAVAPVIDLNLLADARDVAALRRGVRQMHQIIDAGPLHDFEPEIRHPVDIHDDDALDTIIRRRVVTIYHPARTCRMGADDASVVDTRLAVRGVERLWVADASVMPHLISGNTSAPTIMIGERCADFVSDII